MDGKEEKRFAAINADCLVAMGRMKKNSVDSIVTDPPYGISFMGKDFDNPKMMGTTPVLHGGLGRYAKGEKRPEYGKCDMVKFQEYMTPIFQEALRVAKPGAYLLAFGGTRTYHRLACAIEDAGWEVRDCIMWAYGSGFPKSMDISKAIDKKLGAKRAERAGVGDHEGTVDFGMKNRCPKCGKPYFSANPCTCPREDKIAVTDEAKKWNGWGTCLKPAYEPIILARKPPEGTVADNVLKYGVGGLNIDACRVPTDDNLNGGAYSKDGAGRSGLSGDERDAKGAGMFAPGKKADDEYVQPTGRFPANLIHDGSDEVLACFPDNVKGGTWNNTKGARHFENNGKPTEYVNKGKDNSTGSAARFFYCAKASKKERGEGNQHPTVKPIALMKYLVRLVTPEGGTVLDPFMGSGSTGVATLQLGDKFIGMEKEPEYFKIAEKRLSEALPDNPDVV